MLELDYHDQMRIIASNAVSTESFGGVNIGGRVVALMDGVERAIAGSVISFTDTVRDKLSFALVPSLDLDKRLLDVNYATMSGLVVTVPTGLRSTFKEYYLTMNLVASFVKDVQSESVEPIGKHLLWLYGSPKELNSSMPNNIAGKLDLRNKEMAKLKQLVSNCFDDKSTVGTATFGEVFERVADWREVRDLARDFEKTVNSIDFKAFAKKVNDVNSYANQLRKQIASGEMEYSLSAYMANEISGILYNLADEIEFVGAFMQMSRVLNTVFDENVKTLKVKLG